MMKAIMSSVLVASAVAVSAPASAATWNVTSSNSMGPGNATQLQQGITVDPVGGGSYAGGTSDTLVNKAKGTGYFNLIYDLSTAVNGSGVFSFTTSSAGKAALTVLGFFVNGAPVSFSSAPGANGSISYFSSTPFTGAVQSFSVYGSLVKGGSVSTVTAFSGAVPEVSTWLMMMAGIGMIGGALRVSRRKVRFQTA